MNSIIGEFYIKKKDFILDIKFEFETDKIIIIKGDNGSGKTLLLRAMLGLEPSQKAYFAMNNKIFDDTENKIFISPNYRNIGYVSQTLDLFPHLSVKENILYSLNKKKEIILKNIQIIMIFLA